ncbi:MAG: trypsin-like peptidase domain-containing protein [Ethanoligenens sp.]
MFGDFFHHKNEDEENKQKDSSSGQHDGDAVHSDQGGTDSSGTEDPYGGNIQYKWNYDDYQKALEQDKKAPDEQQSDTWKNDFQAVGPDKPPQKKPRGMRVFIVSICSVFGVAVLILAGIGVASMVRGGGLGALTSSGTANASGGITLTDKPSSTTTASATSTSASTGLQMSAAQVVSKVKQSVIAIQTYDLSSVDPSAEGSGIIMSADGYVVTNAHVIAGGQKFEVVVTAADGSTKSYDAKVVGSDTRTDLAVLKIDATGLSAATFGNSSQLQVGESVLAIGNPGGTEFAGSVTSGIISATNRQVTANNYTQNVLQTDAAINPGNSGGALVNMYGQVIGITSSKIEETGYEGMGFAIPINSAKPIVDSIIKNGYVTGRVKLGISVTVFTNYQAKLYNMPTGLLVKSVDSSSDAAAQGMKQGDVISKINDVTVATGDSSTWYDNFYKEESKYKPGDTVTLTVARYSNSTAKTLTFKVKLAEDKGDTTAASTSTTQSQPGRSNNGNNYSGNGGDDDDGGFSFFGDGTN